jgi:hypothetical protein
MLGLVNGILSIFTLIMAPGIDIPAEQVQQRFDKLCIDGRQHPDCPLLRSKLEVLLYAEMHELFIADVPIDREVLRAGAEAQFPNLAAFALQRMKSPESPEDREALLVAVEHPSPLVRSRALPMLVRSGDAWREGLGRWSQSAYFSAGAYSDGVGYSEVGPDLPWPTTAYGIPALNDPRLRYRYWASCEARSGWCVPGRAVYTTKLSPDEAIDLIAKGSPVVTGDKLAGDPGRWLRELQVFKAVPEFSAEPSQVRYVRLPAKQDGAPADKVLLTAAVGYDDALGGTVVVVQPGM